MEYKFTQDWVFQGINVWEKIFPQLKETKLNMLELGTFEGRGAIWFLENVLTHPESTIDCVDTWDGGTDLHQFDIDWKQIKENFEFNISPFKDKVKVYQQDSHQYLKDRKEQADIIYVDASHFAEDALVDGVLSHMLLKPGGHIIFDDYLWNNLISFPQTPKPAIDAFIECFALKYDLVSLGYQVILKKK